MSTWHVESFLQVLKARLYHRRNVFLDRMLLSCCYFGRSSVTRRFVLDNKLYFKCSNPFHALLYPLKTFSDVLRGFMTFSGGIERGQWPEIH